LAGSGRDADVVLEAENKWFCAVNFSVFNALTFLICAVGF